MTNISGIETYIANNREEFQSMLLAEAGNVATKINAILTAGNIDLLKNAELISRYIVGEKQEELIAFAEEEGISWAKHALTLALKLEWIHALRRTLWNILRKSNILEGNAETVEDFLEIEQKINDGIDEFLNNFFISYSKYKDELILNQRQLVEHLTVPIIPVSPTIAVLPLIGKFDSYRMDIIEEKVLSEISRLNIEVLIVDLSGIPDIDEYTISKFQQVLSGVKMMGSSAVLTGIRPNLANKMASLGMNSGANLEVKGTLQQALNEYLLQETSS